MLSPPLLDQRVKELKLGLGLPQAAKFGVCRSQRPIRRHLWSHRKASQRQARRHHGKTDFYRRPLAGRKRNRSARADGKTNQKMGKKLQYKRLLMLTLLLAAAFAGLGYRLVDLQVLQHAELSEEAQSNTRYTCHLEPRRGDILDDRGNLLATSVFVKTVFADPMLVGSHGAEVARAIAPLLQINESELIQKLSPKVHMTDKGESTNRYVVLKRKVSTDVWERYGRRWIN